MSIRGLTYHGVGDVRCERHPDPTPPDAYGAVVRVERAAICGSDLHLYHGAIPVAQPGFVVGHEFVGEIVEVGRAVHAFRPGDRVLASGVVACGRCEACRHGHVVRCRRGAARVFGTTAELPGGQAEAVAVPGADTVLRRIPEGVTTEQAVLLTDILPTGFHGAKLARVRPGDDVAVIGLGPVGLLALESARLLGAGRIFAIDRVPERLDAAKERGAVAIHADANPVAAILAQTEGIGPDAVIEAVGHDETVQTALQLVRTGGNVCVLGVNLNMAFPFPMGLALLKSVSFHIGICPVPELWDELIPLVRFGRLRPERVITHRLPLSRGTEAYALFDERREGVLKVLLDPAH
jgi:2-desacetyl-2-hydroxyethyl bacteriochlorophyllide A dehydrogenase